MSGVTLATFKATLRPSATCADLQRITDTQWEYIFDTQYWRKIKGEHISNESLALLCVDWVWMSGASAIKRIQKAIGVTADGIVGNITLNRLNSDPRWCFMRIWNARYNYYYNLIETNPSQRVFLRGWLNRLNSITFVK